MATLSQLECRGVQLLACDEASLAEPPAKLVVDLRKVNEIAADSLGHLEAAEIKRVSLPVTLDTWSEQDIDALRRELNRGVSPVAVVSKGGRRAALVLLQHTARVEGWTLDRALQATPLEWSARERELLEDYLTRHRRDAVTNPELALG